MYLKEKSLPQAIKDVQFYIDQKNTVLVSDQDLLSGSGIGSGKEKVVLKHL